MSEAKDLSLDALLRDFPSARAVARVALDAWPEHDKFLLRSFRHRSPEVLAASETVAVEVLKLIAGDERASARITDGPAIACARRRFFSIAKAAIASRASPKPTPKSTRTTTTCAATSAAS